METILKSQHQILPATGNINDDSTANAFGDW
jgi:hypothetical protein